jgi:hypothetical protein
VTEPPARHDALGSPAPRDGKIKLRGQALSLTFAHPCRQWSWWPDPGNQRLGLTPEFGFAPGGSRIWEAGLLSA